MDEMNGLPVDILTDGALKLGVALSPKMIEQFTAYAELLRSWNKQINLTAIIAPRQIVEKHFLDSLSVLAALPTTPFALVDIGSGAGFPGLPLAIARPNSYVTLIESTAKKGAFLEAVTATLKLTNVKILIGRAETLAHEPAWRERFDVATARAVAQLATLAELALPLVRVGGAVIAQKSLGGESVGNAAQAFETLGGIYETEFPVILPALADRRLIIIRKTATTPAAYPRRPGIPAKKPLGGLKL